MLLRSAVLFFQVVLLILAILAGLSAYVQYSNFSFSSDGFHYYSAIRNFYQYGSLWEGPTFEYMLGNHTYFTMYLVGAITLLIPSPVVLAMLNVASHFVTSYFLFRIGNIVFKHEQGSLLSILLAILYVLFPMVANTYVASMFMFQPDFLLPPLLMALLFAVLLAKTNWVYGLSLAILFTKEEYVVLYPFIFAMVIHIHFLCRGKWFWGEQKEARSFLRNIVMLYLISSGIIVFTLLYFRSQNLVQHAVIDTLSWQYLSFSGIWTMLKWWFWEIVLGMLPFLVLLFLLTKKTKMFIPVLWLLVFWVVKMFLNGLIYKNYNGTLWGNAILPPITFLCILLICYVWVNHYVGMRQGIALYCVIGSIFLTILFYHDSFGLKSLASWNLLQKLQVDKAEFEALKKYVPKPNSRSYFITDDYLMAPLMDRSHVEIEWLGRQKINVQQNVWQNADFVLTLKNSQYDKMAQQNSSLHLVKQTEHLAFYLPKN